MIPVALVALTLTAAAPLTLAIPGLNGVRLAPGEADLYGELLAQKLVEGGLKVVTSRDVQQMLGVERQKQLLGCSEGSSCVVEMIGALGVDEVLLGDVGALGDEYVINLKILSTKNGELIALHNETVPSIKQIPDAIDFSARQLLHKLSAATSRPDLEPKSLARVVHLTEPTDSGDHRVLAFIPGGVCLVSIGFVVVFEAFAQSQLTALKGTTSAVDANGIVSHGRSDEDLAWTFGAIAAAALITTGIVVLFGKSGPPPANVGFMLTPQGPTFALGGTFP